MYTKEIDLNEVYPLTTVPALADFQQGLEKLGRTELADVGGSKHRPFQYQDSDGELEEARGVFGVYRASDEKLTVIFRHVFGMSDGEQKRIKGPESKLIVIGPDETFVDGFLTGLLGQRIESSLEEQLQQSPNWEKYCNEPGPFKGPFSEGFPSQEGGLYKLIFPDGRRENRVEVSLPDIFLGEEGDLPMWLSGAVQYFEEDVAAWREMSADEVRHC